MRAQDPATERQINYARSLMVRRDTSTVTDMVRVVTDQIDRDVITHGTISSALDVLTKLPLIETVDKRDRSATNEINAVISKIPEGHYALETKPDHWMFYRVDRPTKGRWAGFTFLRVQAFDDFYLIKNPQNAVKTLLTIGEDPRQAAVNYGKRIGRCWRCHRTLTDPVSIKAGLGPICAERVGW